MRSFFNICFWILTSVGAWSIHASPERKSQHTANHQDSKEIQALKLSCDNLIEHRERKDEESYKKLLEKTGLLLDTFPKDDWNHLVDSTQEADQKVQRCLFEIFQFAAFDPKNIKVKESFPSNEQTNPISWTTMLGGGFLASAVLGLTCKYLICPKHSLKEPHPEQDNGAITREITFKKKPSTPTNPDTSHTCNAQCTTLATQPVKAEPLREAPSNLRDNRELIFLSDDQKELEAQIEELIKNQNLTSTQQRLLNTLKEHLTQLKDKIKNTERQKQEAEQRTKNVLQAVENLSGNRSGMKRKAVETKTPKNKKGKGTVDTDTEMTEADTDTDTEMTGATSKSKAPHSSKEEGKSMKKSKGSN